MNPVALTATPGALTMPDESTLELSIDPRTGHTNISEGAEVHVHDERGRAHKGLVLGITAGPEPRYTVLLTCHGTHREITVTERDILARAVSERDI